MIDLTKEEKDVLIHALTGGTKNVYRNSFVTGVGTTDFPLCESLLEKKAMVKTKLSAMYGGDFLYSVTPTGAEAVGLRLPD